MRQVIEEKGKQVVPLNLNIDLKRLTQLFGRSLYIKYFIKPFESSLIQRRRSQTEKMPINRVDDE
jgi:hypothetical protein